jgi:magnesium transporter
MNAPGRAIDQLALHEAHRDFAQLSADLSVDEALREIRGSRLTSRIVYFYVLDAAGRLVGVVPTRRLLLSQPADRISAIMVRDPVALPDSASMLDACEAFLKRRLLALPIVDASGRIVGVIDVDQMADEIREMDEREVQNDVFQLIGVRLAELTQASWPVQFKLRFPWLLCNIAGGLACAFIAGRFEGVLDQVIALALFIPVVLALAESVSIQSLTLTLQSQHGRGIPWGALGRLLGRECVVGGLLGGACGGIVGASAWISHRQGTVALCLLLSILVSVVLATLFGLVVPSVMAKAQKDPRVAAGPLTLALTDMVTLLTYLGLATWMLL